jgi:sugar-specific transcriptional regulator TrmB
MERPRRRRRSASALKTRVAELSHRLTDIERQLAMSTPPPVRVVVEKSYDEAKQEVAALLKHSGDLYPSDIAERLQLPYEQTIDILRDLYNRGVVAPVK